MAQVDALVLSGGSAYGLDAASGVSDALRANGRGFRVADQVVPIVPAAILFDLLSGGAQDWTRNPYSALGRAAFDAAAGDVRTGFGRRRYRCHVGHAERRPWLYLAGPALRAYRRRAWSGANPMGSVTTPGERYFWAAPFEIDGEFGGLGPDPSAGLGRAIQSKKAQAMSERANTTIAIVATDAALTKAECQRVAWAAHDGIARACLPAHSPGDGDLVFAASNGNKPLTGPRDLALIGHAAALCLSRAIARAVYLARPYPDDLLPCWNTLNA